MIRAGLLALLAAGGADSAAAGQWLNLCSAAASGRAAESQSRPDDAGGGRFGRLSLTENVISGCAAVELEATAEDVLWTRILPKARALEGIHHLVLQGSAGGRGFRVSELVIPEPAGPSYVGRKMVLPGFELLQKFTLETYGEEARATLDDGDPQRLVLRCGAGGLPAGLVLRVFSSLPRRAALQLALTAQGEGRFALGYSDNPRHIAGDPVTLGNMTLTGEVVQGFAFDLPPEPALRADWKSLTLACPEAAGHLALTSLRLTAAEAAPPAPGRASWFWSSAIWRQRPEVIFAQQQRWNLNRIFVGIDFRDDRVANAEALRSFVARAHGAGLRVSAVLGDPTAIGNRGLQRYQGLVRAIGEYNREAGAASRLDAIQLDIEPYLDPAYHGQEELWKSRYLTTLAGLAAIAPLPLDAVLPFWMDDPQFLESLAESVRGLTVMDYRTDPLFITERALPFLEWGDTFGIPVSIALETGNLAAAERRYYGADEAGELVAFELAGHTVLVLLEHPVRAGAGQTYAFRSSVAVDFDHVSFFHHGERLAAVLPPLERQFRAWKSFAGFAIHGLDREL